VFSIRVTNDGPVSLDTIVLTDARASSCAGAVTLPNSLDSWLTFTTGGTGNKADSILEPGEWFEYTCEKDNTQSDYTNTAGVTAEAVGTDVEVSDSDTTIVIVYVVTSSSSSSGGTPRCEAATQSGSVVTCNGNSKVDAFYLKCGANIIGPKSSTTISGVHQATFNCTSDTYQCYVYDKDVDEIGGYAWRTSSACLVQGGSSGSSSSGGYCGDGILQTNNGEQCDYGTANNGVGDSLCTNKCKIKACNTTGVPCVTTVPNGGDMTFNIDAKSIIGHLSDALIAGGDISFTNNSDYDMMYDNLCVIRTDDSAKNGTQQALKS
jgi:hypothetical protein